jgi:hypothetical protein
VDPVHDPPFPLFFEDVTGLGLDGLARAALFLAGV